MRFLLPAIALLICQQSLAQNVDLSNHIGLNIQYYEEDGQRYLGVSPALITAKNDEISTAMQKFPRRFRYLLMNHSRFQGIYEKYYPDTILINRLYTDTLKADKAFLRTYHQLTSPFTGTTRSSISFSLKQMMQVAARFFYCQSVRSDGSIQSTICIGRNGLEKLFISTDQPLLETFCFEAIFEKYYDKAGEKTAFVRNFLSYIAEAEKKYVSLKNTPGIYLDNIRSYCFEKMENDESLQKSLLKYYEEHRNSFAFALK